MAFFEKLSAMAKAASGKAGVLARDAADKAGELAKTAADKAGTALEIGKLHGQIRNLNDNIAMTKSQIGHLVWERYASGAHLDTSLAELCQKIEAELQEIERLQLKIEDLKARPEETEVPGDCRVEEDETLAEKDASLTEEE